MTTDSLLELIEQRGLLTTEQVARVRTQVANSKSPVSPKALARHLVDKGLLTAGQAQSLVEAAAAPVAAPQKPAPQPATDDMEFGLAPLEEELPQKPAAKERPAAKAPPEGLLADPAPTARPTAKGSQTPQPARPAESLLDELEGLESPSPLGGGTLDLLSGAAGFSAEGSPLTAPVKRRGLGSLFRSKEPRKRKKGESEFDSPLMLIGGGALVLLLIVGVLVYFLYTRGSGDEKFKLAEDDYRSGAYTQAIAKYNDYLTQFPSHPSVSLAKVHRGMARLRQATEHATDYGNSLDVANSVINEISGEKDFAEAKVELRSLLPDIAEGLAKSAAKQKDAAAVKATLDKAEKALAMVLNTSYISQAEQPVQRITEIREMMAVATRDLDRDAELAKTLAAIKQATDKQEISAAYDLRKKLLKAYPDLADNAALATAVQEIATSEKGAVQIAKDGAKAETSEARSPVIAQAAIATRLKTADGSGPAVAVFGGGALYGFDSASGQLRWRRFVGRESLPPIAVDSASEADLLVADAVHHELLRIAANTGKLVWRQPLGQRISGIATVGKQAVASTLGGKLVAIDLATGDVRQSATLPQSARLPVALNPATNTLYQVAEQSTIYVFSEGLQCLQAYYLGHEKGTIEVVPLALSKHLLVIENTGAKAAKIHVLELAEDGTIAADRQQWPVPGRVLSAPVLGDRKLVLSTVDGHYLVMGITPSNAETPLAEIASQAPASNAQPSLRQLLVESGNLWIADQRLMRYKVQSAAGRLTPSPLKDDYDAVAFDGPLQVVGQTLVHARRIAEADGLIVTGTRLDDGSRLWATRVGATMVGELVPRDSGVLTMTADGHALLLDAEQLQHGALNVDASGNTTPTPALSEQSVLPDGSVVYATPGTAAMVIVGKQGSATRTMTAPDKLACCPIALGKGIAAPTQVGQVFWLHPASGKPVAAPFQPQVSAGTSIPWTTPDVTSDGKDLVISDGAHVYRVGLARDPEPHLEAAATSEELVEPITSPVAVLGSLAFAANANGALNVFQLPDLKPLTPVELQSEVAWGPRRIDRFVFMATAAEELACLDDAAKIVWRVPLNFGPLAGSPTVQGDTVVIASLDGHMEQLSLADGKRTASAEIGQPLHSGAIARDGNWWVVTADGTVLALSFTPQ